MRIPTEEVQLHQYEQQAFILTTGKKEEQLSVYTVRTLLVLPLSLFGVSLWYHFILCCDRQEIF